MMREGREREGGGKLMWSRSAAGLRSHEKRVWYLHNAQGVHRGAWVGEGGIPAASFWSLLAPLLLLCLLYTSDAADDM
eukprot:6314401-Prorocentrum_lima.AAC.1